MTVLASTAGTAAADAKPAVGPERLGDDLKLVQPPRRHGKSAPIPAETIRKALPRPLPPPPPLFSVRGTPPEVVELVALMLPEPADLDIATERTGFLPAYVALLATRVESSADTNADGPLLGSGRAGPAEVFAKAPYGTAAVSVATSIGLQMPRLVEWTSDGLEVCGTLPGSSTLGAEIASRLRAAERARTRARAAARAAMVADRTAGRLWNEAHENRDDISRLERDGRLERATVLREHMLQLNTEALRHNTDSLLRLSENASWMAMARRESGAADELAHRAFDLGIDKEVAAELRASLGEERLREPDDHASLDGDLYRLEVTSAAHRRLQDFAGR